MNILRKPYNFFFFENITLNATTNRKVTYRRVNKNIIN